MEQKPDSNQFDFPIDTQNLDFFYQPALDKENTDKNLTCTEKECLDSEGNIVSYRPEQVVGSYAVYHNDKQGDYSKMGGKNYKAGKAYHIYRPKVTDAAGNNIWGELDVDEKKSILTVTVPQQFLNTASYPITIDPNFGYESAGASVGPSVGMGDNQINGSVFSGAAGTGVSISAYANDDWGDNGGFEYALYKHSDSTLETNGTATGGVWPGNGVSAWRSLNFDTTPTLTAIDYVIVMRSSAIGGDTNFFYDSGITDQGHGYGSTYGGAWPSPASFVIPTKNTPFMLPTQLLKPPLLLLRLG